MCTAPATIPADTTLGSGLLSLISHEIRTPLATATTSAELVQMRHADWTSEKRAQVHARTLSSLRTIDTILEEVSFLDHVAASAPPSEAVLLFELLDETLGGVERVRLVKPASEQQARVVRDPLTRVATQTVAFLLSETSDVVTVRPTARSSGWDIAFASMIESEEAAARLLREAVGGTKLRLRIAAALASLFRWQLTVTGDRDTTVTLRLIGGDNA